MKKIVLFFLFLLVSISTAFTVGAAVNMEVTVGEKTISSYNKTRWQDNVVIYTKEYNRNTMGYEVLVDKTTNFVIEKDVLVDLKDNTFIVSVHGVHTDFLIKQVEIGDYCVISGDKVIFTRHLKNSNIKKLELEEEKVNAVVQHRIENFYDVDKEKLVQADQLILEAKNAFIDYIDSGNVSTYQINSKVKAVQELINSKYYASFETYAVEGRALWHRPNASSISEGNLAGVIKFVEKLHELGINALFVETYWNGMTTYPSEVFNYQHPRMANYKYSGYNDYIDCLISECHKYGIEVHAWVEVLCGGSHTGELAPYVDESWICSDLTGSKTQSFMDPSHPGVQEFLRKLITEMVQKYDWDGISYDYIRYDSYGTYNGYIDCGFSDNATKKFKEEYGYTGTNLIESVKEDVTIRAKWHNFKRSYVTKTVEMLTELIRSLDKELVISASPYGYINDAKVTYMQDIATWLNSGYLDVVCPMIYTESVDLLKDTADRYNQYTDRVLQYTGISPIYNGASVMTNQELSLAIKELNISGIALFASQNYLVPNKNTLTNEIFNALPNSSHRGTAITPTSNPNDVFYAWKELFLDRYNRIYKNELSGTEQSIIDSFNETTSFDIKNPNDINNILRRIKTASTYAKVIQNTKIRERILEQFDYIYNILDAAITRHLVRYGYWDMENESERPDVTKISFKEEYETGKNTTTTQKPTTQSTTQKPITTVGTTENPSTGNNNGGFTINCETNGNVNVVLEIAMAIMFITTGAYIIRKK